MVIVLSGAILLYVPGASAVISNGGNAVNMIGQLNPDAGNALIYTKNGTNNGPYNDGFDNNFATILDSANNRLFATDSENDRVLIFNLNGSNQFVDRTADAVLGQLTFIASSPTTTQSGLRAPGDIAYDSTNQRLFVADTDNNRVTVFDVNAITNGENAVNVLGQATFTASSYSAAQNRMNSPRGVFYDSVTQKLYVGDTGNNRILIFDVAAITDGENAVNVLGQADFVTSTAGTTQSTLSSPYRLCLDSTGGRLFAADMTNDRVMVFDVATITDGENAVNVLGQANFVSGAAATSQSRFTNPQGCAYDGTGNRLFVADGGNNRIMIFDVAAISDGENAVNVLGQANFTSNSSSPVGQNSLFTPTSAFFDSGGNRLFVPDSDNFRIMIFDVAAISDGENATDAVGQIDGSGNIVYTKNGKHNGAKSTGLDDPYFFALDTVNHRLFVSDRANNRVLVFNLNSSDQVADYTADFVLGQSDFLHRATGITQSTLNDPRGLVYDSANQRLFVADFDNNRVLSFDVASITDGESAVNVLGQANFTSKTSATTQSGMSNPFGLAYDSANQRLFAANHDINRVLVFDVNTITNGENAVNVLGQANFTSNSSALTQSGMYHPSGLAYDSANQRLFAADYDNNRVLSFDVASITDGESAVNVIGQANFTSNSSALTQSAFNRPTGVFFDSVSNRLFVGDYTNNRVLVFDLSAITDGENAVNVIGQANFTSASSTATQSTVRDTVGVTLNPTTGELLVADRGHNRVMIFDAIGSRPTSTVPTVGAQSADGLGSFNMNFQVNDTDDTGVQVKVEHSIDGGTTWRKSFLSAATASAGLAPTLDNNATYQIGSLARVDVSGGANTLNPVTWLSTSASNGGGALTNFAGNVLLRVTPFDGLSNGTAQTSASFSVDDLAPSGLTALTSSAQTSSSVSLNWTAVTETNFNHYEIWYGTGQTDVQNRVGAAVEWDNSDDAALSTRTTATTIVTGLNGGSNYYFKIWAIDNFGNEHTVADLLQASSGGGSSSRNSLEASVSLRGSLGSHRDLALVRIVGQLLRGERMISGRISRAEELVQFLSMPPRDIVDITENAGLRSRLLKWVAEDAELKKLLRGQRTERLIFEVWETGKVGEPFLPVAKVENIVTNLFGEASLVLPRLKIKSYTFTIRKPLGLRQTLANVELSSSFELAFPQPLRVGDFNGDGMVNSKDFQKFISDFKSRHDNPGDYDLNEDGELDLLDFAEVLPGLQ